MNRDEGTRLKNIVTSHVVGAQVMIRRGVCLRQISVSHAFLQKLTHHIPYLIILSYEFSLESVTFTDPLLGLKAELMTFLKIGGETVLHIQRSNSKSIAFSEETY